MQYVCKITRSGGQSRITLPKGFLKSMGLEESAYVIIEDETKGGTTIKGVPFEKESNREGKAS